MTCLPYGAPEYEDSPGMKPYKSTATIVMETMRVNLSQADFLLKFLELESKDSTFL